jgi:ParB family transcriptional regulator, chromosome partitioning protein
MTLKKRGLGRGLEALLVDVSSKLKNQQPQTLPIDSLQLNDQEPLDIVGSDELQILANSFARADTIEPVVVRKTALDSYEIVAGETRWRAALIAGLTEIPVIIEETDDQDVVSLKSKENLLLLQEAEVLKELLDELDSIIHQL